MWKKVVIALVFLLGAFLLYVSTRESTFRYERSGVINASADKIFPYISNLKRGGEWSPYEQNDPNMKKVFSGEDGAVGSKMDFDGNAEAGSGSIEILKIVPNERVELKLIMTKPMHAENLIEYTLKPEGAGTRFVWTMSGDGGYMTKLISVFIDCEKMVAGEFEKGIANLKKVVEAK